MDEPHVTIIKERGSGGGWLVGIVLLAVLAVGVFFAVNYSNSNAARNSAITAAATSVGNAANSVGEAAKKAAK